MPKKPRQDNYQAAWSGLVLVVVTFMLIGVYFLRINTELVSYDIDPNLVNYKTKVAKASADDDLIEYKNEIYNFIFKYQSTASLATKSSAEGDLEIFTVEIRGKKDVTTVNVMPVEMQGVVKSSINIEKEYDIDINGMIVSRIDGSSIKDGSEASMVIIEGDDNIITIEGTGQNFEDVVSYFETI